MAISPAEKAESIADCWEKQFELNDMSDDISDNYIIHQNTLYFNSPIADHYHTISAEDIVNFIKTLNPKNAARHDKISNNMLIYLPPKFIWWLSENEIPSPPQPAEEVPAASTVQTAPAAEPISSGSAIKRKNPPTTMMKASSPS
ncbi:hypothetical protein CEXT_439391 [Caerostris extrusa]|uniref:Uncharacterized protein n=1 Tax=Caerostris extrusa TaxID=172846 RepID=A0AAV4TK04_CAEEX|nr:hypothetical protein CEXT_439391 [Caerostris extrusa]